MHQFKVLHTDEFIKKFKWTIKKFDLNLSNDYCKKLAVLIDLELQKTPNNTPIPIEQFVDHYYLFGVMLVLNDFVPIKFPSTDFLTNMQKESFVKELELMKLQTPYKQISRQHCLTNVVSAGVIFALNGLKNDTTQIHTDINKDGKLNVTDLKSS